MSCLETMDSQYTHTHNVWCRISPSLLPTSWCALIGLVQFSSPWITADWHTNIQYLTFNWDGADWIGPIRWECAGNVIPGRFFILGSRCLCVVKCLFTSEHLCFPIICSTFNNTCEMPKVRIFKHVAPTGSLVGVPGDRGRFNISFGSLKQGNVTVARRPEWRNNVTSWLIPRTSHNDIKNELRRI